LWGLTEFAKLVRSLCVCVCLETEPDQTPRGTTEREAERRKECAV